MGRIVAIVGRPNVGKSTLFNRLVQRRDAIVDDVSGVTRDRHYGKSDWNGVEFSIIDTGGYINQSDDIFENEIKKQITLAIEEANVILFLVDAQAGLTDMDKEVGHFLRKTTKPVFLVANKVDQPSKIAETYEFYELGYEEIYPIAANNGGGTGDLLDEVIKALPIEDDSENWDDLPKIAIVGKPNVGKSTFMNALLEEERSIVTDIAGTTRDSIMMRYNKFGFDFVLVDTAGMRKKSRVREDIEFYSVMRSVRTIEYADVCVLMLDATLGLESQDLNILYLIERNLKGLVVVVNKWDLIEKDTNLTKKIEDEIRQKAGVFSDFPIVFISSLNKQRIHKSLEKAVEVYQNRMKKVKTSKLNDLLLPIIERTPPPAYKGKYIKIKYITQLPTYSPKFAFFANFPQYVKEPYKRFLENQLRENFNFEGVPIEIFIRKK